MSPSKILPEARRANFFRDLSASTLSAGIMAVMVGYASSVALVFAAAQASGADAAKLASWMGALGIGMGLACLLPSLILRQPVMMAWSTPGAAVLAVSATNFSLAEATGAFVASAALVLLFGLTGWFEKLMNRIPMALASALLAGVLANFALNAFAIAQDDPIMIVVLLLSFLLLKARLPRWAIPCTLVIGVGLAYLLGQLQLDSLQLKVATPVFTAPEFTLSALLALALPLFIVTMTAQNLPGVAAMRTAGYVDMPISKLISVSGGITLLLAPFGAYMINLAAITAAICMGPDAHPDPRKRYTASMVCGLLYLVMGIFGASIASLLIAFPKALILGIAGLALLGTIAQGLQQAVQNESEREAAVLAFLVTLSGVTLADIGSAFWGVVAGLLALLIRRFVPPR